MTDAKIREIIESFQQGIRQQQGKENVVSPGGRWSSCVSMGFVEEESTHYPMDDITKSKVCKLVVSTLNITITVAMGQVDQCVEGALLNDLPIPRGYAKVHVDSL